MKNQKILIMLSSDHVRFFPCSFTFLFLFFVTLAFPFKFSDYESVSIYFLYVRLTNK